MRSYGRSKRKCASITSRPLFARVAESIVIFAPMFQVGCASASAGVTSASSSAVRPRNGPPLAVSTIPAGSPASAHWKSAECSLSTGISVAAASRVGCEREVAGGDKALLVRERERDAVLERPHRRREPGEAEGCVQDDVGPGPLEQLRRVTADLGQRREPVDRRRAGRCGDELELRARRDHLERLAADRAGRAEQRDAPHAGQCAPSPCGHPGLAVVTRATVPRNLERIVGIAGRRWVFFRRLQVQARTPDAPDAAQPTFFSGWVVSTTCLPGHPSRTTVRWRNPARSDQR